VIVPIYASLKFHGLNLRMTAKSVLTAGKINSRKFCDLSNMSRVCYAEKRRNKLGLSWAKLSLSWGLERII